MTLGQIQHECCTFSAKVFDCREQLKKLHDRIGELEQRADGYNKQLEKLNSKVSNAATNDQKFEAVMKDLKKVDSLKTDTEQALEKVHEVLPNVKQNLIDAEAAYERAVREQGDLIALALSPKAVEAMKAAFEVFDEYEQLRRQVFADCRVGLGDISVEDFFDQAGAGRGKPKHPTWLRMEKVFLRDCVLSGRK